LVEEWAPVQRQTGIGGALEPASIMVSNQVKSLANLIVPNLQ
jgi:hypothetical protein